MTDVLAILTFSNSLPFDMIATDVHRIAGVVGLASVVFVISLAGFDDEGLDVARCVVVAFVDARKNIAVTALITL